MAGGYYNYASNNLLDMIRLLRNAKQIKREIDPSPKAISVKVKRK